MAIISFNFEGQQQAKKNILSMVGTTKNDGYSRR